MRDPEPLAPLQNRSESPQIRDGGRTRPPKGASPDPRFDRWIDAGEGI